MKESFVARRSHPLRMVVSLAALFVAAAPVYAQETAKEFIALGDKETEARNGQAALKAYEEAIRLDSNNIDALLKATTVSVALAEFEKSSQEQGKLIFNAEQHARRAFELDSNNAMAHFAMAQALGRAALVGGQMAQLKYSTTIFNHAQSCLKIDPKNEGCAHVLGNWYAEVMRLNGFQRKMAAMMTKSPHIDSATWEKAISYMEMAIKENPKRAVHHFVLAKIYLDAKEVEKARAEYQATIDAPLMDFNDEKYKEVATEALKKIAENTQTAK
jgi:tetratricopeptide (TPR) repeat protein